MAIRLKIVSDGTPQNTVVQNILSGEKLDGVTAIEWRISTHGYAEAKVTMRKVAVEIISVAHGVKEKVRKRRIELE